MNFHSYHINLLQEIQHQYETYVIDIIGVISDGQSPFNNAITTINNLLNDNKQIIFLSNNPRPSAFIKKKLQTFGLQENYYIVTSGDLLHHALNTTLKNKKIYHLGRNRQHALLEGTKTILTSSPYDADAIILSCFVEGNEDPDVFNNDLKEIIQSQKPVYCPNPDRLTLEGTILRYPSGYFAHKLEQQGYPIIYLGKPYRAIYDFITYMHPTIALDYKKTLMIGDTLETDIYGATNLGIDSLLILSGISGLSLKSLDASPYKPRYVMEYL